jgi:hypothetical protein
VKEKSLSPIDYINLLLLAVVAAEERITMHNARVDRISKTCGIQPNLYNKTITSNKMNKPLSLPLPHP